MNLNSPSGSGLLKKRPSWSASRRQAFEIEQIHWMIDHTASRSLSPRQKAALKDSMARHFSRCPQMDAKPFCSRCPLHCFSKAESKQIRTVMKSAGWKLLLLHPLRVWTHVRIDTGRL